MAIDITELVGKENMNLEAKPKVIALLQNIPQPPTTKRYLYARWARVVGFHPTPEDLNTVAPWGQ